MISRLSTTLVAALALPLLLLALLAAPSPVVAHGYLSSPPSRQAVCARGLVSNCGPVIYEPQSVEALKGLRSCNGGASNWAQLADESKAWPTTSLAAGVNTFTWTMTAVHPTASFEYYIGGTRIALITGSSPSHSVNLAGYSGRQKILAIWNIGDTANAFYACTDVVIGGGGGGSTPTQAPTSAPTTRPTAAPTAAPTARPTTAPTTTPTTGVGCTTTRTVTSTYVVKAGDSLGAIAATNRITLAALLAVNPTITNANLIYIGQVINIPKTTTVSVTCSTVTPTNTPRRRSGLDATAGDMSGGTEGFTGSDGSTGIAITKTAVAVDATGSHHAASAASTTRSPMVCALVSLSALALLSMAFAS